MIAHPYIRYAIALLMQGNEQIGSVDQIEVNHIVDEIQSGIDHFSLIPKESYEGKEKVKYAYSSKKSEAKSFCYLSPSIVSTDLQAGNFLKAANDYLIDAKKGKQGFLHLGTDITQSQMPMAGEFASFTETIGRLKPKTNKLVQGLCIVTSLTNKKPCISVLTKQARKPVYKNTCIIPDLPLEQLIVFIETFNRLLLTQTNELLTGRVEAIKNKKSIEYLPKRPSIMRGNFPNAPLSVALGSITLLGALGEEAKVAEYSTRVKGMLDALKDAPVYIVEYGKAKVFYYNHYVVDLAKDGHLKNIVDSLFKTRLYKEESRTWDNPEYQKFDMFASRFLQLFNSPSFKDFLSFRAEYPAEIELLFKTYFSKMENIDIQIIKSAKSLGSWLNYVAYKAAEQDTPKGTANYWDVLRQKKAKVLVELESSVFSSKTGDSLISQVITRAGRLVGMDAPSDALPFMEAAASGELELDKAKNLLIAFSRVKSMAQAKETKEEDVETSEETNNYSGI